MRVKARKSPDKLNGKTSYVLYIPIHTRLASEAQVKAFSFKTDLEEIRIWEIDAWAKENLTQNLSQLRNKRLEKVA